jgi:ribosomal protein S18 acetylase RimI-like enzyme
MTTAFQYTRKALAQTLGAIELPDDMEPILLDRELARRIELAEAQAGAAAAVSLGKLRPDTGACVEQVAGGWAAYAGAGSPVTQAIGLALDGRPVSDGEFSRLEEFYRQRNEPVRVEACPLAHASLFERFAAAGYRVTEFTNVLALGLREHPAKRPVDVNEIQVRQVAGAEIGLWAHTVATAFVEGLEPAPELLETMQAFALADGVRCYLAEIAGQAAGGGTLILRDGVAGLFGAGTLPAFRKRGVQTELLRERMERGRAAGCELAVCLAAPGSSSERNVVRRGFQVLYTRTKFEK